MGLGARQEGEKARPARAGMAVLPGEDSLAPGEMVSHRSGGMLRRRGRSEVRVRVVGNSSLGWLELADSWGARVEAVVHERTEEPAVYRRFDYLTRINITAAFELPPRAPWDGLVLGTVTSTQ